MKIFDIIENHLESVGLTVSQQRFNVKNVTILSLFSLNILLTGEYIAFEAKEFEEYVDSLFGISTVFVLAINFLGLIWQTEELCGLITKLRNTVNESK